MLSGSELRAGIAVRVEGTLYKVLESTYHSGQGKMGGVTHAKLRNLETDTVREWRFRADEPVEDITPERQNLQFLYKDDRLSYFMHPQTFEQVAIENSRLGRAAPPSWPKRLRCLSSSSRGIRLASCFPTSST